MKLLRSADLADIARFENKKEMLLMSEVGITTLRVHKVEPNRPIRSQNATDNVKTSSSKEYNDHAEVAVNLRYL